MTSEQRMSTTGTVFRILVGVIGLFFLVLGIGFMAFPDIFAALFSVAPAYGNGVNAIRSDLGGLFLGMSFFCLMGAAGGRRGWLAVPIVFLILIIAGRLIGLALDETSSTLTHILTIELALLVFLITSAVVLSLQPGVNESGFRTMGLLNLKSLIFVVVVAAVLAGVFLSQKRSAWPWCNALPRRP